MKKKRTRKLIYISKTPEFEISVDKYQWILTTEGISTCYFPNLSLLLDELAESLFRTNATKVKELNELNKVIDGVYELIDKTRLDLKRKGHSE